MSVSRYSSLCAMVLSVVTAAPALGLANRVFMSTTGSDSNNCANPNTPCLTFAGSLAQVAAGGEVIAEATGGYGAINVTQSVTISGPPGVLIFSNYPVIVNAPGATVVLRGLTIDGTGAHGIGINVVDVSVLHVESCVITGWAGNYPNGNGIFFAPASSYGQLFVKDTIARGNDQAGIMVEYAARASVDHCRLEQNGYGLVVSRLSLGFRPLATIKDSVASGNSGVGLWALGGELNVERCLVANNSTGLEADFALSAGILRASNCTVTDNEQGIQFDGLGGLVLSALNNTVEGNGTNGIFNEPYFVQ